MTFLHCTAGEYETIMFSADKIGYQIEMSPEGLSDMINYKLADVIV